MMAYDETKVRFLSSEILRHKKLYYEGKPEVSDFEYDAIEQELKQLDPQHPVLDFVGTDVESITEKASHRTPMLSLQKVYDVQELVSWVAGREVIGTWKIDGNSLSLVYEEGRLSMAKTRGNGRLGENVSDKARWVPSVLPTLSSDVTVEIRGELCCTKANFRLLVQAMKERGLEPPTNPRNIVAGVLGRKLHFDLARYFTFLAFEVLDEESALGHSSEVEVYDWLASEGFSLPGVELITDETGLSKYLTKVEALLTESEIGLDGAVFSYNDLDYQKGLGATSHHPRGRMSFKWQGDVAQSRIDQITWATSRLGIVTPVAVIEPVELSGAKITNVTLHNAEHVKVHNLKKGDVIEIVRSGEVIPKFLRVIEEANEGTHDWLEHCPSCGEKLHFDDVRLSCGNKEECPAQNIGRILNWIKVAQIDDLSEKRLESMMEMDLVGSIEDLYTLTIEDFLKLPLTKEKMAQKLFSNIQKSKKIPLSRFLTGLGIQGVGLTSWEKFLNHFPDLDKVLAAKAEDIEIIEGFAEKTALQVATQLSEKRALINSLIRVGVEPYHEVREAGSSGLDGLQFVITGKLSRPRNELAALIKDAGGKVASAVSKNTHAVITEDVGSTSSKMKKARELGIEIWSEERLNEEVGKGSK